MYAAMAGGGALRVRACVRAFVRACVCDIYIYIPLFLSLLLLFLWPRLIIMVAVHIT